MKKTMFFAAAALAVAGLASCSGNKSCEGKCDNCDNNSCTAQNAPAGTTFDHDGDMIQTYTGVLPAADADGINYILRLEFDKEDNFRKGDYDMTENYIANDTTATTGFRTLKTLHSEGDFTVSETNGKKYLKLVQDAKDSQPGSLAGPVFFLVENDSTITMVNADLQPSENKDLNYTLTLSK